MSNRPYLHITEAVARQALERNTGLVRRLEGHPLQSHEQQEPVLISASPEDPRHAIVSPLTERS